MITLPQPMGQRFQNLAGAIFRFGRMIKFSHTIFALPFVLSAVALASRDHDITIPMICWILLAAVSARSAAMGFNRVADARLDAINPRTMNREIPTGRLSLSSAVGFVAMSSMVFMLSAFMLGPLCFQLSIPALCILFGYSYTKRFTRWCHLYLGFAISLAPLGAWIAVTGTVSAGIFCLSLALLTYIAGFDIIYACQDVDFDQAQNLHSLPSRAGVRAALILSSLLHGISVLFFLGVYLFFDMGWIYLAAILVIGGLYVVEHLLVNPEDLKHIDIAFFHVNSVISLVLLGGILADEGYRRWLT